MNYDNLNNTKMYNNSYLKNTRKLYLDWLANNQLKNYFHKNYTFQGLSLWWVTKLIDKNNKGGGNWFSDLNKKINSKYKKEIKFSFIKFFARLIFSFLFCIFIIFLLKIFYKSKKNKAKKKNCYYVFDSCLVNYKKSFIDYNYGFVPFKNKHKNAYLVELKFNFSSIYNFISLKKKLNNLNLQTFYLHDFIFFKDIIQIYKKNFFYFFKILFVLKKENFFLIDNIDCSSILKKELLNSFSGSIQKSLIRALAVKYFFSSFSFKKLVTSGDFSEGYRSVYFFLKKLSKPPLILAIQHDVYTSNNLTYQHNKNDFNHLKNLQISPKPDIFLTQGRNYFDVLLRIFPKNKVFIIGNLKLDTIGTANVSSSSIKNYLKIDPYKKTILVYLDLFNIDKNIFFFNSIDTSRFNMVFSSHPSQIRESKKKLSKLVNFNYIFNDKFSSIQLSIIGDFIFVNFSPLYFYLLFLGKNVNSIIFSESPYLFENKDFKRFIYKKLDFELFIKKKFNFNKKSFNKKINDYFYKFDHKASLRVSKILSRL
jgi:hypothetical protein